MSAVEIGSILGRLAVSYSIVWTFLWLFVAKRDWRHATLRTRRWYGVVAVFAIFSMGLITAASRITIV